MKEKNTSEQEQDQLVPLKGMYENWFLDYASYVILERAVPSIEDGFKPVQRRIMHALKELDDGRFNKIANVIGHTMSYHPHGDASIGDAVVHLGQKNLLIDTQGNWGDNRTGDPAAASRYIEGRLSKFALEVVFNPQTTPWQNSYDGRKKEPVTLPVKFPLLLMQGVEGIAVGLSTKILPHNYLELIEASIKVLKNKKVTLFPDFHTGGLADFSEYNQGVRGGKVRIRAVIKEIDSKTLVITGIPFSTTTNSLIDSIIKANDKGKIKIKSIVDSTAKDVEIIINLGAGQSPDITLGALYAFTDCEVSISPNACVIVDERPMFMSVVDILKKSTLQTKGLLNLELEIRKNELLEKILFSSLEKIFIQNRIYHDIEECETWEAVISTIDQGLTPFKKTFYREITQEDITRLTEIKIKRISKYDAFKADESLKKHTDELEEVKYSLVHLVDYTIAYFKKLKEKYGKGRERKTIARVFENLNRTIVAANNQKLYGNLKDGFLGYGIKKEEFICECSDIDDIIGISRVGKLKVKKVKEKDFFFKNLLYATVWKKKDDRMTYNMIYLDGVSGRYMVKRFNVTAITRDREYSLTKSDKNSKIIYLTANPNGEAEIVTVKLSPQCSARKKSFDFNMADIEIKGRSANGNILTRYPIRKINKKIAGESTLNGLDLWFDYPIGRINTEKNGEYLGNFLSDAKLLVTYKTGCYELTNFNLTNRYDPTQLLKAFKFSNKKKLAVIYYDGKNKHYFAKSFVIETLTENKKFGFISVHQKTKILLLTYDNVETINIKGIKINQRASTETAFQVASIIPTQGRKTIGLKLPYTKIFSIDIIKEAPQRNNSNSLLDLFSQTPPEKTEKKEDEKFKPGDTTEL